MTTWRSAAPREAAAPTTANRSTPRAPEPPASVRKPLRPRKLSFKEARELEGMEALIVAEEAEIARIESLFASPDFYRTHARQANELRLDLAAAKETLARHFTRWEELEALQAASQASPA